MRNAATASGAIHEVTQTKIASIGDGRWARVDIKDHGMPTVQECIDLSEITAEILNGTPNLFTLEQLIDGVIEHHSAEGCMFAPDTKKRVMAEMSSSTLDPSPSLSAVLRELSRRLGAWEIYCPHEGIDRRAEFGIAI